MTDGMKRKHSADERGHEAPKKQPLPWSEPQKQRDESVSRESQRRATAYGRARGRA